MANDNSNNGFGGVMFGKNTPKPKPSASTESPKSTNNLKSNIPNQNLTSSLRASLKLVESETEENPIPSPLNEATPDSIDILLDRINSYMIEGKILSDEDLRLGIDLYRSQALRFAQEQQTKKPRAKAGSKSTLKQVLNLDFDDE